MAVDRVEQRLRRVTAALDEAGIQYAVIGGNAVAAWVARVDAGATRATRDVDILVKREDDTAVAKVMNSLGFERHDLRRMVLYVDPDEPAKRSGVHLVWAGELVKGHYPCPAPRVSESVRDPEGFLVLRLEALVRMKLTSMRDIDRVHITDLIAVGLIDDSVRGSLPDDLKKRLDEIQTSFEDEFS
jgi:hypothetical protein